jgi:hypothetical protein
MTRPFGARALARHTLSTVAVLGAGAILIAGCSSASSNAAKTSKDSKSHTKPNPSMPPSSTASPATKTISCKQIDSLRTSLTDLTKTKVSAGSASKLSTTLNDIQMELATLKGKTSGAFADQAKDLTSSIDQIQKTAAGMTTNPKTATKQLSTDLAALKTKSTPIIAEMNAACPGPAKS